MMLKIFISFFLIGLLIFLTLATFTPEVYARWSVAYYIWSKSVDILFGLTLFSRPKNLRVFRPVFVIIVARWLVNIIFSLGGWALNDAVYVGALFILAVIVAGGICIKELYKWQQSN